MKNLIIGISIFIITAVGVGALVSAGTDQVSTQPASTRDAGNLLRVWRTNFMQECNSEGGLYAYCDCSFNYLIDNYSMEYLSLLEGTMDNNGMVNGNYPDELYEAANYCADEL